MTGERNIVFAVMGKLFFDNAIQKDFDRGLVALKAAAESRPDVVHTAVRPVPLPRGQLSRMCTLRMVAARAPYIRRQH